MYSLEFTYKHGNEPKSIIENARRKAYRQSKTQLIDAYDSHNPFFNRTAKVGGWLKACSRGAPRRVNVEGR